jgi:thiol-disulfide isomerase/thioredoxin
MQNRVIHLIPAVFLALFVALVPKGVQGEDTGRQASILLPSGDEVTAQVYGETAGEDTRLRILWIGPGYGVRTRHQEVASALGREGVEVWLVELADALFLIRGAEGMRQIPGEVVADVISVLADGGRHRVVVVSNRYGAIPAIRGIHAWQSRKPQGEALVGAVLFTPYFFTHVPQLGKEPSFIPEMYATNAPIYIIQAAKNGNRWHLPAMADGLRQHAPVYSEVLPGVTSLFFREDKAPETLAALAQTPRKILRAIALLQRHEMPVQALPVTQGTAKTPSHGLDAEMKPYRGSVQPTPFSLTAVTGERFDVDDFTGQVTLVNFWASWCGPCVEEIPSLNRLKEKMRDESFRLISINYAESPQQIRAFMKKVDVAFPVLLDKDGALAGQWKVVAFPSTFVIGPDGKIHYGVNAAIYWDSDAVVSQLRQLAQGK